MTVGVESVGVSGYFALGSLLATVRREDVLVMVKGVIVVDISRGHSCR